MRHVLQIYEHWSYRVPENRAIVFSARFLINYKIWRNFSSVTLILFVSSFYSYGHDEHGVLGLKKSINQICAKSEIFSA